MHVWFYDSHGALYHVSHVLIWRCRRECRWRDVAPSLASLCCKEHVYVRLFFTFRRRQESASDVSIYDEISSSLSSSGEPRWLTEWLVASLPAIFLIPPPPLYRLFCCSLIVIMLFSPKQLSVYFLAFLTRTCSGQVVGPRLCNKHGKIHCFLVSASLPVGDNRKWLILI